MKQGKKRSRIIKPLDPSRWVRNGFRARHNLSDADIAEMLKPENIRVAISIKIPLDVLNFFKASAEKGGTPYQTQINRILRAHVDEHRAASGTPSDVQVAARSAKAAVNHLLETLKDSGLTAVPRESRRRQA